MHVDACLCSRGVCLLSLPALFACLPLPSVGTTGTLCSREATKQQVYIINMQVCAESSVVFRLLYFTFTCFQNFFILSAVAALKEIMSLFMLRKSMSTSSVTHA